MNSISDEKEYAKCHELKRTVIKKPNSKCTSAL